MKKIIILQSKDDCLFYQKTIFSLKDTIIPIGPDSLFFCKEYNLNHYLLSDLSTHDEHVSKKKKQK